MFRYCLNINSNDVLVDGSTAGSGNLEILVNGGHVTSYVRELGDQCFLASFVPHQATIHTVDMKFNGETVRGNCHTITFTTSELPISSIPKMMIVPQTNIIPVKY